MKRRLIAIGAATAVAFSASPALAGTATYRGQLDNEYDGTVEFKVKKKNGVRKVKAVSVENIVINCSNDQSYLLSYAIDGPAKVKKGSFKLKSANAVYTVEFKGDLNGPTASGTTRYFGFTETADGTFGCDSGHTAWTASR
jgi:hypothetical protein